MKLVSLLGYATLLISSLGSFFLELFRLKIKVYKPVLFAILISSMLFLVWMLQTVQSTPLLEEPTVKQHTLEVNHSQIVYLTQDEMIEKLTTLLELHRTQPTHRDITLNIALLYDALGDEIKAQFYYDQAKSLDPNNDIFSREN